MDTAELRESIAKSVRTKRDRLRAATPKALFAGLVAAAVAPVLVPLLAGAGIGGWPWPSETWGWRLESTT